jgi:hypothetical protein
MASKAKTAKTALKRMHDKHSYAEIARVTGYSPSTIKRIAHGDTKNSAANAAIMEFYACTEGSKAACVRGEFELPSKKPPKEKPVEAPVEKPEEKPPEKIEAQVRADQGVSSDDTDSDAHRMRTITQTLTGAMAQRYIRLVDDGMVEMAAALASRVYFLEFSNTHFIDRESIQFATYTRK